MTKVGTRHDRSAREAWQAMADLVLDNERRREVTERTGLSFGRMKALRRIARRPMPMRELAALLGVDPPNLTSVVDELERSGLVERQPHPTDRRVKLVVATPEGQALTRQAEEILDRPPDGLVDLPLDDLELLAPVLPAQQAVAKALALVHVEHHSLAVAQQRVGARGALVERRRHDLPLLVRLQDRLPGRIELHGRLSGRVARDDRLPRRRIARHGDRRGICARRIGHSARREQGHQRREEEHGRERSRH